MSEKNNRAPSHRVYIVKGEGENSKWTEIGVAWANADGQGYAIVLDALPISGRLVMRAINGGQS
jgi:hypothetical protein